MSWSGKHAILSAYLSGKDIRAALVMTNTTADTQRDAVDQMSDYTTLDECNAAGYARVALASEAAQADDANDRAEFTASNISFTGLGGDASRAYQGIVLFEYVDGTAANDKPLVFHEFPSTIPATATQVNVNFNAEGIVQLAQA